jgi:uncharacterized cupredoxin-like copper-binding protein
MTRVARAVVATALAIATAAGGYGVSRPAPADAVAEPGPGLVTVNVGIRYSRFSISTLHVRARSTVRFLIRNDDPIEHEFIVGDAAVHAAHEHGSESVHPPVPGEVSVGPDDLGETFFVFARPGRFLFACHLPGHFAYGMHGWVIVES